MGWLQRLFGETQPGRTPETGHPVVPRDRSVGPSIRIGKYTSIGYFRDNNEDRLIVDDELGLYIVADGMGGQAAGEQASQIAIDYLPKFLRRLNERNPDTRADDENVHKTIIDSVIRANRVLLEKGETDSSMRNMGTTLVMMLVRGDHAHLASLGDSRAYRLRDGQIEMLTTDHNLAQVLLDAGTISKEELKTHRFKNRLYKFLGAKEADACPDYFDLELQAGDRFILATDGLTGSIEDDVLRDDLKSFTDPQKCAEFLVNKALDNGSRDNVTCIVIFCEPNVKAVETPTT